MVQKSKILGEFSLIFVTVGTTNFQFNRLFYAIDIVLDQIKSQAKLIIQSGNSSYQWKYKNILTKQFFSPPEMKKIIKASDRIITHAGPGTLFLISQFSRIMPLVVARMFKLREHASNHQVLFTEFIKNQFEVRLKKYFITEETELIDRVKEYLSGNVSVNKLRSHIFNQANNKNLFTELERFINL